MLQFAQMSVWKQSHPALGHFIVNDFDRRGVAWTRQQALESNRFEWTAFLDSDDWFAPQHLQRLAETQMDTGADFVYSWYWIHNAQLGGVLDFDPAKVPDPVFRNTTHFTDPWDKENPRHTTITTLVRTELALEVGFHEGTYDYDPNKSNEDWEFIVGCNKLGNIYHLPERTWYWRHHGRNTSGMPGVGDAA